MIKTSKSLLRLVEQLFIPERRELIIFHENGIYKYTSIEHHLIIQFKIFKILVMLQSDIVIFSCTSTLTGLCVSGGIESRVQPEIKVEQVLECGAAADEPAIQVE